ncbi:hypothetical protein VTO58DRAFT_106784 [Aureobasidium pullulans]
MRPPHHPSHLLFIVSMHSVVDLPPSSLLSVSSYLGLFPPLPLLITCNQLSSLKVSHQQRSCDIDAYDITIDDSADRSPKDLDSSLKLTSQQQISGHAFSLQIWIVMVLWASTIHGIPSLPGPKAPHNAPPSTGPIDEPPRLGSQKTSPSRDWNADLTVEDGLFPTSIIWNSPSSTNSSFECLQLDVTPRVKAERERKDFAKALRNMNQRVDDLHTENVERLADMTKKMDRAIKSDGKFQIQLDNIRESVDAIGVAFVQFGMDDEKVQLIVEEVVDAPHH